MPISTDCHFSRDSARDVLYRRFSERGVFWQRCRLLAGRLSWRIATGLIHSAKRILDILMAVILLVVFSPALLLYFAVSKGRVVRTLRMGYGCELYNEYAFSTGAGRLARALSKLRFHRMPVLWNIFKGDMSFVGPRPVSPGNLSPRGRMARKRYEVRPGLICLWWIRDRANIAYEDEAVLDHEYVERQCLKGDVGIALRAFPALLYGKGGQEASRTISILGIPIDNLTMSESVDYILNRLHGDSPSQVCFANADCANITYRDPAYLALLQEAHLILADGIGFKLAGKMLGREVRQNVNGTDLFPRLCAALSGTGKKVFLLGGRPGVADAVRDWMAKHYPDVVVCGVQHGYFSPEEESAVVRQIADQRADLLLVAMGVPHQDKWISRHLPDLGVRVAMGVGGLFDFYSGRIPRAPVWMRESGIEWVYRFYQEPRRM